MFNEGNQIHNFMSNSGSGTVINYGYGSGYGSGSTSQKVTVPTVPVPVPQHCKDVLATVDEKTWKNYYIPSVFKVNSRSIEIQCFVA